MVYTGISSNDMKIPFHKIIWIKNDKLLFPKMFETGVNMPMNISCTYLARDTLVSLSDIINNFL